MMPMVPSEKLSQAGVRGGLAETVSPVQTSVPQVNSRVTLILISIWDININTRLPGQGVNQPRENPRRWSSQGLGVGWPPKATQSSSVSQGHSSRLPGCPRCFPEAPSWFWPAWLCLVSENKEKRCGGAGGRGGAGLRHAGRPLMARLAHVKTHQPQSSRKRVPFCMEWREYSATRGGHYVCRDPSSLPLVPMSFPTHVLA